MRGAGSLDDRGVPPPARDGDRRVVRAVLALCGEAGLVQVGVIAIDGTRMRANASRDRNRGYESIVTEILAGGRAGRS